VAPDSDLESVHSAFFAAEMDVLVGCGNLDNGDLALDVTAEGDSAEECMIQALFVSEAFVGDGWLSAVGPDLVGPEDIAYLLCLNPEQVAVTLKQHWFPEALPENRLWHLDNVLWSIKTHGHFQNQDMKAMIQIARVTRDLNVKLQESAAVA
jgi:hypothetical protein